MRNDGNFPIAVSNVAAKKTKRIYTKPQQCDLDIRTSRNLIGEIINLSQELNTIMWHKLNNGSSLEDLRGIYEDICILNVLSGIEIDKAKKEFSVDSRYEIKMLRQRYLRNAVDGRSVKPNFFAAKDRGKGYYNAKSKKYEKHDTTMDYLQTAINSYKLRAGHGDRHGAFLPFSELVTSDDYNHRNVWRPKIERAVELVRQSRSEIKYIYASDALEPEDQHRLAATRRQDCIDYVGEIVMTRNTMIYFLKHLEDDELKDICRSVFNTLFGYPNSSFFDLIKRSREPVPSLVEDPDGDLCIFDLRFRKEITKNGQIT